MAWSLDLYIIQAPSGMIALINTISNLIPPTILRMEAEQEINMKEQLAMTDGRMQRS